MPSSNGHYSQCIEHNGILYVSGQLPIEPALRTIPKTIKQQTSLVLNNIESILLQAGSTRNDIIQVRIYISDIKLWEKVNTEFAMFFGKHKPVRCIIQTRELHFGALIEIEVKAISKL